MKLCVWQYIVVKCSVMQFPICIVQISSVQCILRFSPPYEPSMTAFTEQILLQNKDYYSKTEPNREGNYYRSRIITEQGLLENRNYYIAIKTRGQDVFWNCNYNIKSIITELGTWQNMDCNRTLIWEALMV